MKSDNGSNGSQQKDKGTALRSFVEAAQEGVSKDRLWTAYADAERFIAHVSGHSQLYEKCLGELKRFVTTCSRLLADDELYEPHRVRKTLADAQRLTAAKPAQAQATKVAKPRPVKRSYRHSAIVHSAYA